jgi:hypothetical protein
MCYNIEEILAESEESDFEVDAVPTVKSKRRT